MKYLLLSLLFLCSSPTFSKVNSSSTSGYLYQTKSLDGEVTSLYYDDDRDEYVFLALGRTYSYKRFRYKDILRKHIFDIASEDLEQFKANIKRHANTQKFNKNTPEETLSTGLLMGKTALSLVAPSALPCVTFRGVPGAQTISYKEDKETKKINNKKFLDLKNEDEGFLSIGKLTGFSLSMDTCNDNPLHGLLGESGLGITTYAKGIEGDDRGKTFCVSGEVKLTTEQMEIALRTFSDGYGRKVSVPGNAYISNGKKYISYYLFDEEGRRFQEFLTVSGVEIEIRKELGYKDIYVKVIARQKTIDDLGGTARSLQESYHNAANKLSDGEAFLYNYTNWMEKKTGYEVYVELGRSFEVYSSSGSTITSTPYLGRNASSLGEEHRYYTVGADIKAVFKRDDPKAKFPSWSARAYLQGKRYDDGVGASIYGVELTKYFQTSENSSLYLEMAIEQEKDRYNRAFGAEELERNGRLDFNHKFNMGWEYKF